MTVYVKPWCPWCIDALKWLRQEGYTFKEIDVLSDRKAYDEMQDFSGQSLTPTLRMPDGKVLADFDIRQLESFLEKNDIHPE